LDDYLSLASDTSLSVDRFDQSNGFLALFQSDLPVKWRKYAKNIVPKLAKFCTLPLIYFEGLNLANVPKRTYLAELDYFWA
jgi:hypothetical protein